MITSKKAIYSLSKDDSLIIKGLAICFMLWHHLFYEHSEYGILVQQSALVGKACVAMFLFISGYGLTVSYQKIEDSTSSKMQFSIRFLLKRFLKFYFNYWFVFILFVPIGVFLFDRSLSSVYGEHVNIVKRLLIDFFGVAGLQSYNITWWFNQLIIYLYLLFPIIYWLTKRFCIFILIVFLLMLKFHPITIPIVHNWLFHFSIGVAFAMHIEKVSDLFKKLNRKSLILLFVLFGIVSVIFRLNLIHLWSGIKQDGFLTLCIVMIVVLTHDKLKYLKMPLAFLGKHSMNIFMIHTFIFYYWFKSFIYWFKYPVLIFSVLLLISVLISVIIETLKNKSGLLNMINKIENKIVYSK